MKGSNGDHGSVVGGPSFSGHLTRPLNHAERHPRPQSRGVVATAGRTPGALRKKKKEKKNSYKLS